MRNCPNCGKEIKEEAIFCRYCRHDVIQPQEMSSLRQCPYCAEYIEIDFDMCPLCGKTVADASNILTPSSSAKRPNELIANFRQQIDPRTEPPEEPPLNPIRSIVKTPDQSSPPFPPPESEAGFSSLRSRRIDKPQALRPVADILSKETEKEGRKRFRLKISPTLFRGVFVVLLIGVIGVGGIVLVAGPGKTYLNQLLTPPPTLTKVVLPTRTPSFASTLPPLGATEEMPSSEATESALANCLLWSEVTVEDAGQELCVYGIVKRWFASGDIAFVAIFTEELGTFEFVDHSTPHPEVKPGKCMMAEGTIEVMRGVRPFIDIAEEFEFCPEEMENP